MHEAPWASTTGSRHGSKGFGPLGLAGRAGGLTKVLVLKRAALQLADRSGHHMHAATILP